VFDVHTHITFTIASTRLRTYTGCFKSTVTNLRAVVAQVTPDMLRRTCKRTGYRWDVCRATTGSNIALYQTKLNVSGYITIYLVFI
jgi:SMC interacting uncharacterized protein involved in chromosome segregation